MKNMWSIMQLMSFIKGRDTMLISILVYIFSRRNNRKISAAQTTAETKKATIRLLRTIVVLSQSLQSLPDEVMMTMKLLYYDDGKKDKLDI